MLQFGFKFLFVFSVAFCIFQALIFSESIIDVDKKVLLIEAMATSNNGISQGQNLDPQKIRIVAAGDFGCEEIAENNLKEIKKQEPNVFLALGDLSYEPKLNCWFDMIKDIESITKIAVGNHDDVEEVEGSKEVKNEIIKFNNETNSYYSFDYGNVHFLVLDSQLEFSMDIFKPLEEDEKDILEKRWKSIEKEEFDKGKMPDEKYSNKMLKQILDVYNISKKEIPPHYVLDLESGNYFPEASERQFQFAVNDLKKASENSGIDWIIVIIHKPFYSSLSKHMQEYTMREKYQPIFDKYGVDLVLQAHNHIYDRTFAIKFNPNNTAYPDIDYNANNKFNFSDPDGSIYSVIGLGGRSSHIILNNYDYVANKYNGFGFLTIDILGKQLNAKYYDIGYECDKEDLKENDFKLGHYDFYDVSSCKLSKDKNPLKVIDQYNIIKSN